MVRRRLLPKDPRGSNPRQTGGTRAWSKRDALLRSNSGEHTRAHLEVVATGDGRAAGRCTARLRLWPSFGDDRGLSDGYLRVQPAIDRLALRRNELEPASFGLAVQ